MKNKFDELIDKIRKDTAEMKKINNRLEEINQELYNLRVEISILGNKTKDRKLGREDILN